MIEIIETTADAITPATVGRIIKKLRNEKLMYPKEVTITAGVSDSILYYIENKGSSPNLDTLTKILDALGYELTVRSKT